MLLQEDQGSHAPPGGGPGKPCSSRRRTREAMLLQ